jgi:hypothetical protein
VTGSGKVAGKIANAAQEPATTKQVAWCHQLLNPSGVCHDVAVASQQLNPSHAQVTLLLPSTRTPPRSHRWLCPCRHMHLTTPYPGLQTYPAVNNNSNDKKGLVLAA